MSEGLDARRLQRLLEVGESLVSEHDLEAVLAQVLETARELTGARYAALGIHAPGGQELDRFIVSGIGPDAQRKIGKPPRGRGILGELIKHPGLLRMADLGKHPQSVGFPSGHPPMATFLGGPILIRGKAYGDIYLTEKHGGPFTEEDESALSILSGWAAIAIANARLHAGLEAKRDDLELAVRRLEATTAIAAAVGAETDPHRVLDLIVKRARTLVQARIVVILLEESGELRLAASAGPVRDRPAAHPASMTSPFPGGLVSSQGAMRVADKAGIADLGLTEFVGDATTALLVPLAFRGRSSGLLVAVDRLAADPHFDIEDERLLIAFAASAGTAVATAQTVETRRLSDSVRAAEAERSRWARELHDETLQGLAALQVLLSTGRARPGGTERAADRAIAYLVDEIASLQALITELRPAALDQIGLGAAITSLMERADAAQDAELTLDLDLDYEAGRTAQRLRPDVEDTLFRLIQEALTNVRKHAEAKHVAVSVVENGGTVTARVADDGIGVEPKRAGVGFGLIGMRERASLVGGAVELMPTRGGGTTVVATIPLCGMPG